MTIAAYGGSFDPVTMGHCEVIKQASKIFEKVIVVVARNAGKTATFTFQERLDMLRVAIGQDMPNVEIGFLPDKEYLASYATKKGATVLIRGLRDSFDFGTEQKQCDTNRKINQKIQTVFIMPPPHLAVVSSSWAKELVGYKGWKHTLDGSVHPHVIDQLELSWLKKEVKSILDEAHKSKIIALFDFDTIWKTLVSNYQSRSYHNLPHIGDMLLDLDAMICNEAAFYGVAPVGREKLIMKLAIIFHDLERNEADSARYPLEKQMLMFNNPTDATLFTKFIMATKHADEKTLLCPEAFIADLDLLVLAGEGDRFKDPYWDYVHKIQNEYIGVKCDAATYKSGRISFLQSMLGRKRIFYTDYFEKLYGAKAKDNMKTELERHKLGLPC